MKRCLIACILMSLSMVVINCRDLTTQIEWIPLKSEYLRNGSVAMYSVKNKIGKIELYYKNHIFREAGDCVISQEYTGQTAEYIKRLRLDGVTLNLISYDIIQNNTEADLDKTTIAELQFKMLTSKKTNQTYLITDYLENKPSYTRLYTKPFLIENDFLLTVMTGFPFEEHSHASYQVVNTMKKVNDTAGNETAYLAEVAFTVIGQEEISYKRQNIPSYKVNFPSENLQAWFSVEIPHMLIKAEFPERTIELVDWNEI